MKTTKMRKIDFTKVVWTVGMLVGGSCGSIAKVDAQSTDAAVTATDVTANVTATTDVATSLSDAEFNVRARVLFAGGDLGGWEGNGYWFRVENRSIVAGRLEMPIPKNQFLCTMDVFDDFDLRLDVRMAGPGRNAGVQFRSRRPKPADDLPANEVVGYQADMGEAWGRGVWGALYDESRRQKMLAEPETPFEVPFSKTIVDAEFENAPDENHSGENHSGENHSDDDTGTTIEATDWVAMRIVAVGNRIQIYLNGVQTIDYTETDPDIPPFGKIGLQIHSGPPAQAWYRNIRILSL